MVIKENCHTAMYECKAGGGKEEKERFFRMHVSLQLSGIRLQTVEDNAEFPFPFPGQMTFQKLNKSIMCPQRRHV